MPVSRRLPRPARRWCGHGWRRGRSSSGRWTTSRCPAATRAVWAHGARHGKWPIGHRPAGRFKLRSPETVVFVDPCATGAGRQAKEFRVSDQGSSTGSRTPSDLRPAPDASRRSSPCSTRRPSCIRERLTPVDSGTVPGMVSVDEAARMAGPAGGRRGERPPKSHRRTRWQPSQVSERCRLGENQLSRALGLRRRPA